MNALTVVAHEPYRGGALDVVVRGPQTNGDIEVECGGMSIRLYLSDWEKVLVAARALQALDDRYE